METEGYRTFCVRCRPLSVCCVQGSNLNNITGLDRKVKLFAFASYSFAPCYPHLDTPGFGLRLFFIYI